MYNVVIDLQAAEIKLHELHTEAEHERLVKAALKLKREQSHHSFLSRYLNALKGRNPDGSQVETHKN